jgi:polyphenol oxidase
MFYSKRLSKFKNLKHCFFSRKNGFSKGAYESLNCGLGSKDKKINVLKNLKLVTQKIGCKQKSLITLNQSHSNKVIYLDDENFSKNKFDGDAIITKSKNTALGVLTADCGSILFYDPKNEIIGSVHSGWKGAISGIIKNTVKKFEELNSNNDDLIAVVGPCIKKENYEVGIDFFDNFMSKDKKNKVFFQKIKKKKYFFDLRGFINKEIYTLNVKKIENIQMDTFSQKDLFYSYRRSCLNKEKDYGRCISVILMT